MGRLFYNHMQAPKIFDIAGHYTGSGSANDLPRFRFLCKANVAAMEAALRIANVNPYKILFGDSVHNIQASMGLASKECCAVVVERGMKGGSSIKPGGTTALVPCCWPGTTVSWAALRPPRLRPRIDTNRRGGVGRGLLDGP
ncbi:uncharacterized protein [Triticum aestivum]|uniref:uncharacterized protein isoform X2 n=1 Tax=Triticum aestivum TaxID=4565 RepID=UPI001D006D76|nr:uncharacterized protein LOC123182462 isoform X2 [Triticum aestivum]